jgi:hypothetical protein
MWYDTIGTVWLEVIIRIISFGSVLLVLATESVIKQTVNIKYI